MARLTRALDNNESYVVDDDKVRHDVNGYSGEAITSWPSSKICMMIWWRTRPKTKTENKDVNCEELIDEFMNDLDEELMRLF